MNKYGKIACAGLMLLGIGNAMADDDYRHSRTKLKVFAPAEGDIAGVASTGFLVDLAVEFPGDLASTGASLELTGGGVHANAPPFPGTFSPGANKDHFPGLVVLLSSTRIGAGPGHNLSNLFNIISVTNRTPTSTEIWATWIIGAKNAFGVEGVLTSSELLVTVVEGSAPDVVQDMNSDGKFDNKDLVLMGHKPLTRAKRVEFVVNGL
jgi:hypothetical protein